MASLGLKMKIVYCSEKSVDHRFERKSLEEVLTQSDIVSIHTPLNPKTRGMIGKNELSLMKRDAVLINTSRGEIIKTDDLYEALLNKSIYGAGLDVTDPEPLPMGHPLHRLDNCYLLPHIGSANFETREIMSKVCAENIIEAFKGQRPKNQIN